MEVEVKVWLKDRNEHSKVSTLLSAFHKHTLFQENLFFDDKLSKLSSNSAILRLRFYDSHCVLSLKARPTISNGISHALELEESLPLSAATPCVSQPCLLSTIDSNIIKLVQQQYGVNEFVCLGGFKNMRAVYEWKGLKLELDETIYAFGTTYEIECESLEPERDKNLIEGLLNDNGIQYHYSELSKFDVFCPTFIPFPSSFLSTSLSLSLSFSLYKSGGDGKSVTFPPQVLSLDISFAPYMTLERNFSKLDS